MRVIAIHMDESADRKRDAQIFLDKWAQLSVEAGPMLAELYLLAQLETASAAAHMANMLKRWFEEGVRSPDIHTAHRNLIMMMRAECNPLIGDTEASLLRRAYNEPFNRADNPGGTKSMKAT